MRHKDIEWVWMMTEWWSHKMSVVGRVATAVESSPAAIDLCPLEELIAHGDLEMEEEIAMA